MNLTLVMPAEFRRGVLCFSDSDFMSASRISCAISHSRLLQDSSRVGGTIGGICRPVILFEWGHTRYSDPINSYDQFFRIPVGARKGKETLNRGKRAIPVVALASM